jgi:hypothetical protein
MLLDDEGSFSTKWAEFPALRVAPRRAVDDPSLSQQLRETVAVGTVVLVDDEGVT